MGRAKGNRVDALTAFPWAAGVIFGIGGLAALRVGLPPTLHAIHLLGFVVPAANLIS